jgi:hypothetical protein
MIEHSVQDHLKPKRMTPVQKLAKCLIFTKHGIHWQIVIRIIAVV